MYVVELVLLIGGAVLAFGLWWLNEDNDPPDDPRDYGDGGL